MAEIINHNPEDNPRLNEIYEILLLAGYFRIRISSLKAFDKVIGGIAWCITSSNFEIEVDYNDEMQIGQKIKVSEHICNALVNMKCPYTLQPFQLQGLDVNNIFPVVQWLVKFVYETRFERQKYNREISVLLGRDLLKLENRGNADKIPDVAPSRSRINRQIVQIKQDHPIRVYSALLEFNDATSLKMYHKLHNIITNRLEKEREKERRKGKKDGKEKPDADDFMVYLQAEDEGQEEELQNFGEVGKFSLEKLEKIIEENKEKLEDAIREHEEQDPTTDEQANLTQQHSSTPQEQQKQKQASEDKELRLLKQKNEKYEAQLRALKTQLQNLIDLEKQINEEKNALLAKKNSIQETLNEVKSNYNEIEEIGTEIENQLAQKKSNTKVEKLAEKKIQLKQKKNQLKKKAKARLEELQQEKIIVEASVPEIDEEAFKHMIEQAEMKKEIYDKKYEELTKVNQQLAILQRKAENYTSPAEITQYHQKFIELFEAINCLIEDKRSMYNETTNLESIRKVIANYQEFLSNAKDGVVSAKKKNDKKELAQGLKEILDGFEGNMRNAKTTLEKLKSSRESSYGTYMDLVKLQREYLKVLRNFKVEYENVEKLYK